MELPSKIILLIGFQASTKSSFARDIQQKISNAMIISNDTERNKTINHLLTITKKYIEEGKVVIIDNTNLTRILRKQWIDLANQLQVKIDAHYFKTTLEECQIRHLFRCYETFGYIPQTGKLLDNQKHPHAFGPAALYAARKSLEEPEKNEGFTTLIIRQVDSIVWNPAIYHQKALFLDIDGTIRQTEHLPYKYPTSIEEVELIRPIEQMRHKLEEFRAAGYQLIGLSNQSGISRGILTDEKVEQLFEKTRSLLGYTKKEFPILYCPHAAMPPSCFCRKPQSGMAMDCIMKLHLNPLACLMVGDRKTDESMAKRLQIPYQDVALFWK
jgi:D-glycero-D-manno-heptose 1,7-bisphosphate phosphatase